MIKKQISIQPEQEQLLKSIARAMGISVSALVRQALDAYFSGERFFHRDLSAWEREKGFIDSLLGSGPAQGERTWSRADLY
jgi:hypothetical protein